MRIFREGVESRETQLWRGFQGFSTVRFCVVA